jgi:hypothetical protein
LDSLQSNSDCRVISTVRSTLYFFIYFCDINRYRPIIIKRSRFDRLQCSHLSMTALNPGPYRDHWRCCIKTHFSISPLHDGWKLCQNYRNNKNMSTIKPCGLTIGKCYLVRKSMKKNCKNISQPLFTSTTPMISTKRGN